MTNHPNRAKKARLPGYNPAPEEIVARRLLVGLTQTASAAIVYKSTIAWKKWEAGERRMPGDTWEFYLIKTDGLTKEK